MERTNPNKHQIYVKVCPKRIAQQKLNVSGTTKTTSAEGRRWTTKPLRLGRQQTRLRHRKRHPRRKPPRHLKHRSRRQHLRQPHRSSSLSQQAACGARDRAGSISRRWTRVPKQRVAYVPAVAAPAAAPAAAPTGPATAAPKTPPTAAPPTRCCVVVQAALPAVSTTIKILAVIFHYCPSERAHRRNAWQSKMLPSPKLHKRPPN